MVVPRGMRALNEGKEKDGFFFSPSSHITARQSHEDHQMPDFSFS